MREAALYSNIKQRMTRGALWTLTGTAFGKLLVLAAGVACARLMTKTTFGELGMVRSTINMFIVFGAAGIGVTATHYIARFRHDDTSHAASIVRLSNGFAWLMGACFMVLMAVCAHPLACRVLHAPHLYSSFLLGGLMLMGATLNGALNGILSGLEDFKAIAWCTLCGCVAEALLMTLGAWQFQLEGAVVGYGLGIIVLYACYRHAVRRALLRAHIPTHHVTIRKDDWQLLLRYSLPAALSALTVTPVFWALRTMIVRHDGYSELAVFEAADQWKVAVMFVPAAISQIALPILSSMRQANTFRQTLRLHLWLIGGIATLLSLLMILAAPVLMACFGKDYGDNATMMLLALSVVFACMANVIEMAIYSLGKMWTAFTFNIGWGIVTCIIAWLLMAGWHGAAASAAAILAAYLLKTLSMGLFVCFISSKRP